MNAPRPPPTKPTLRGLFDIGCRFVVLNDWFGAGARPGQLAPGSRALRLQNKPVGPETAKLFFLARRCVNHPTTVQPAGPKKAPASAAVETTFPPLTPAQNSSRGPGSYATPSAHPAFPTLPGAVSPFQPSSGTLGPFQPFASSWPSQEWFPPMAFLGSLQPLNTLGGLP